MVVIFVLVRCGNADYIDEIKSANISVRLSTTHHAEHDAMDKISMSFTCVTIAYRGFPVSLDIYPMPKPKLLANFLKGAHIT